MDGRDAFLTLARDKHYEFSSLRRTKYSTMAMLYELHNQGQDRFVYTCNNCKTHVETRFHCTVCDDFDLCVNCYEKDGHPHRMEKLGFHLDDGSSSNDQKQSNPQESRRLSIQRCKQSLVHACQCRDANCRLPSCQKMKRVVQHTKSCKRKTSGGCLICKQLIALCCYHAKHCQENKCLVPFCLNIKHKLRQQQLQARLQQAQMLMRRVASMTTMQNRQMLAQPIANHQPSQQSPNQHPVLQTTQPGIGIKPTPQGPPPGALVAVQHVQAAVARQQSSHISAVSYGKGNPSVNNGSPGVMPPPQLHPSMQKPANARMLLTMSQWDNRYQQSAIQQQQQQQQQQVLRPPGPGQSMGAPSQPALRINPSQSNMPRPNLALQQLLHTLKSPSSPQQQQQVLDILKSNPELTAAFIKLRTAQQQQQQQQMMQQQALQSGVQTGMQPGLQNNQRSLQGSMQTGLSLGMQAGLQSSMPSAIQGGIQSPLQGGIPSGIQGSLQNSIPEILGGIAELQLGQSPITSQIQSSISNSDDLNY